MQWPLKYSVILSIPLTNQIFYMENIRCLFYCECSCVGYLHILLRNIDHMVEGTLVTTTIAPKSDSGIPQTL